MGGWGSLEKWDEWREFKDVCIKFWKIIIFFLSLGDEFYQQHQLSRFDTFAYLLSRTGARMGAQTHGRAAKVGRRHLLLCAAGQLKAAFPPSHREASSNFRAASLSERRPIYFTATHVNMVACKWDACKGVCARICQCHFFFKKSWNICCPRKDGRTIKI